MNKPELLAPAGNMQKMKMAIHYGADAVYLGLSALSLRAKAGNFDERSLKAAIEYAHDRGVKCYVTINIFPHNRDLPIIEDHIQLLGTLHPDGVIISDIGVFELMKKGAPDLPVHISTQANTTNLESAAFWERMGARRLILARELNIDEIAEIKSKVNIEIECFIHGSVCISYSGRCYMSAFLSNRSGNRGECAHPCRWNYTLVEEKRPGVYFPVYENDRGTYVMSSKDLCMLEHLDTLLNAGVDCFKIEGRNKGINYIAGVVKTYREAIDALSSGHPAAERERWLEELQMVSSRGHMTGMYFGEQNAEDYNHDDTRIYRMSHSLLGIVLEKKMDRAKVLMRNRLFPGDRVAFLTPGLEGRLFEIGSIEDENHHALESTRNDEIVWLPVPDEVREGDIIRKPISSE